MNMSMNINIKIIKYILVFYRHAGLEWYEGESILTYFFLLLG